MTPEDAWSPDRRRDVSRLIDLDQLRVAIPDPAKRMNWLLGATTATMRGLADATAQAAEAMTRFTDAYSAPTRRRDVSELGGPNVAGRADVQRASRRDSSTGRTSCTQ